MNKIFEINENTIQDLQSKRANYELPNAKSINNHLDGIQSRKLSNYAIAKKVVTRDFLSRTESSYLFSRYTKEQINNFLATPDQNEKNLRDMSIYLYHISNQYKSIINYFANMPTFAYVLSPLNLNKSKTLNDKNILAQYYKVSAYVQNMNIAHEFGSALNTAFREDCFFGYIWSTDSSWTLQRLDANYCQLSGKVDGCWVFGFDFQYFVGREAFLEFYPAEFQTKYKAYQSNNNLRWQDLEPKNIICIKINDDLTYQLPVFVSLFGDIANIQDYKDLYLAGTEMQNYKLIHAELQTDKDGNWLIDGELAKDYYNQLAGQLPDFIGLGMSPFKLQDFKFEKSNISQDDDVRRAEETAIRSIGINPLVFGVSKDAASAAAAKLSVTVNETFVFRTLKQIERNINRLLKDFAGTQKFNITMLPVTYFNQQEYLTNVLKCGTYGLGVRSILNSIIGISESNMSGILYLENELLKLQEQEKPLVSSNTQSGSQIDEGGAPTAAETGGTLDTAGEQAVENVENT